jgi:hypothetical protein
MVVMLADEGLDDFWVGRIKADKGGDEFGVFRTQGADHGHSREVVVEVVHGIAFRVKSLEVLEQGVHSSNDRGQGLVSWLPDSEQGI